MLLRCWPLYQMNTLLSRNILNGNQPSCHAHGFSLCIYSISLECFNSVKRMFNELLKFENPHILTVLKIIPNLNSTGFSSNYPHQPSKQGYQNTSFHPFSIFQLCHPWDLRCLSVDLKLNFSINISWLKQTTAPRHSNENVSPSQVMFVSNNSLDLIHKS